MGHVCRVEHRDALSLQDGRDCAAPPQHRGPAVREDIRNFPVLPTNSSGVHADSNARARFGVFIRQELRACARDSWEFSSSSHALFLS